LKGRELWEKGAEVHLAGARQEGGKGKGFGNRSPKA